MVARSEKIHRLSLLHAEMHGCRACEGMIGPVVTGPPIPSRVLLVGQAPGPREGGLGRPFAWTAGKTLFRWFAEATGVDEATFRDRIYMTAIARCFPGKAPGGGDRRPNAEEVEACSAHLSREVAILRPSLILPVGTLAISEVLGHKGPLVDVIGETFRVGFHGVRADAIALPHPSGASTWHKTRVGARLLAKALRLVGAHPTFLRAVNRGVSLPAPHL